MSRHGRLTESQVADAVMRVLGTLRDGEASVGLLKRELPNHIELSDADRTPSVTRPGEELWEQQVRNLVSHRKSPGNAVHDGLLAYRPGRLAITEAGRARIH